MRKLSDSSGSSRDEESAQGAARPEEEIDHNTKPFMKAIFLDLWRGKKWWVQCISIYIAAFLTYSYYNTGLHRAANLQIAVMTVIVLVGSSPFQSHVVPATLGAFVGGQNIILATSDNENTIYPINYVWLLLLSVVVGLVWYFCMSTGLLNGSSGRLGTTTFIGMNITMLLFFGPLGVVKWDRYVYGLYNVVNVGEEDTTLSLDNMWKWTKEAELAIGYFLSVVWLGSVGGAIRISHNNYVLYRVRMKKHAPVPLHNVLVPALIALTSMLLINATGYKHASGLYNGFAVGSYVAMASLHKIPTIKKYILVSCMAGVMGLMLTPFFVGFAGKSGFTAMLGHQSYDIVETLVKKCRRQKWRRQVIKRQEQEENQMQHDEEGYTQQTLQPAPTQDDVDDESPALLQHYHSHTPRRENSVLLKHQRRQQHRLKHYQDQKQGSEVGNHSPVLQHRGWSVAQADTSDGWHHSLELH